MTGGVVTLTGTQALSQAHYSLVIPRLTEIAEQVAAGLVETVVSGAAEGADSFAARWLAENAPTAVHLLVVPSAHHNAALVREWEARARRAPDNFKVERMPPARTPALAFRQRNQRMVEHAAAGGEHSRVVGFPLYEEHRQPRSGTWMTLRMGRRAGLPVERVILARTEALF